ncbi:MAG: dTDP-4-dehydrorhamnose reductase [Chloroflexota bacterium]|nr:dTDP-4-dehydrorhamnose reductase [Chloroflexota bacterium]
MRIAITGGRGQLGRALDQALSPLHQISTIDLPETDITRRRAVDALTALAPDLVIHAAAMTDVDGCARDPQAAFRANALGTQNVALACQRAHAVMLYISTNEVFDGAKNSPYLELDEPHAINPYGASKLAGERYVQLLLNHFYIVRTAWMYSRGGNNFPSKIIAAAKEQGHLAIVDDEIGNPTYAPDLARAIAELIETNYFGIYHLVGEGIASRYAWVERILQLAGMSNLPLTRIKLADYKRDSTPPRYGALANFAAATTLGIRLRPWQDALEEYFNEPISNL